MTTIILRAYFTGPLVDVAPIFPDPMAALAKALIAAPGELTLPCRSGQRAHQ